MQEIIVYQNPIQARFWNNMDNGGLELLLIVGCLFLLWVFLVIKLEKPFKKKFGYSKGTTYSFWTANITVIGAIAFLHFYNVYM